MVVIYPFKLHRRICAIPCANVGKVKLLHKCVIVIRNIRKRTRINYSTPSGINVIFQFCYFTLWKWWFVYNNNAVVWIEIFTRNIRSVNFFDVEQCWYFCAGCYLRWSCKHQLHVLSIQWWAWCDKHINFFRDVKWKILSVITGYLIICNIILHKFNAARRKSCSLRFNYELCFHCGVGRYIQNFFFFMAAESNNNAFVNGIKIIVIVQLRFDLYGSCFLKYLRFNIYRIKRKVVGISCAGEYYIKADVLVIFQAGGWNYIPLQKTWLTICDQKNFFVWIWWWAKNIFSVV